MVQLISGVKQKFVLNGCIVTFNLHLGLFSLITVASITPRIVSSICLCVGPALVPGICFIRKFLGPELVDRGPFSRVQTGRSWSDLGPEILEVGTYRMEDEGLLDKSF